MDIENIKEEEILALYDNIIEVESHYIGAYGYYTRGICHCFSPNCVISTAWAGFCDYMCNRDYIAIVGGPGGGVCN